MTSERCAGTSDQNEIVAASSAMPSRTYPLSDPLDLRRTLAPLSHGPADPTIRLAQGRAWWATRTVDGPATIALARSVGGGTAEALGPGAERALENVPVLLGFGRDREPIAAGHPLVD